MRRQLGTSAGLLALLAVFLHTQFAPSSEGRGAAERPSAASAGGKERAGENGAGAGEPLEGPWLASQAYFHVPGSLKGPSGQDPLIQQLLTATGHPDRGELGKLLGLSGVTGLPRMWTVVATVPDPLHTRMALYLDGQIGAIEHSLQSARWEFAGQWLPWGDHPDAGNTAIEERRRQRWLQRQQDEMPGLLIFRSQPRDLRLPADGLLFVFLVPETATAGINGPSFFAAMHMADLLTSEGNKVGLLAPTFSGSFSSLTGLVQSWQKRTGDRELSGTVYSGGVSNIDYADAFKQTTRLAFHGGIVDTRDYQDVFCEVLKQYGFGLDEAALLKEDETGYSNAFEPPSPAQREGRQACNPRTYVFSRDIAHLRNAYQEATGPAARDPYASQSPSISFSIRDPNSGEDSIPIFSTLQTPLTQDAIVDSIMEDFRRRNTRVVFIAAANVLDTLFLMRAIRRESPDTRVLIENPNVLLVPAAARDGLSGAVMLSSYPMFPEGEDWLDQPGFKSVLFFDDSTMQGLYNVSQLLLSDIGALGMPHLRAYRGFQGGQHYPGIWVLTLNRYGFAPLNLRQRAWTWKLTALPNSSCEGAEDCGWLRADSAAALPAFPAEITPLRSWRISVFLVSVSILIGCFLVIRCNLSPTPTKPLWFVLTGALGPRFQALMGTCLSLTAFDWILISPALSPAAAFFPAAHPIWLFFSAVAVGGLAAPLLTFAYLLILRRRRYGKGAISRSIPGFRLRGPLYSAVIAAFFAIVAASWYESCYGATEAGFFFRFRAMDLYSGSSPAVPLATLALICFCVSILYFKRYTLAGPGHPRVEFTTGEGEAERAVAFQKKLQTAREAIDRQILAPSTLRFWPSLGRTAAGVLFAIFTLKLLGKTPWAFELPGFNAVLLAELSLILFWLAVGCYDLAMLWKRMKRMLDLIEMLPLQPAFERVAREWPRRPIWAFRKSVSRQRLVRQMTYALHERAVALRKETARPAAMAAGASAPVNNRPGAAEWTADTATTADSAARDLQDFLAAAALGGSERREYPALRDTARGRALPGAHFLLQENKKFEIASAAVAERILRQDLRPRWHAAGTEEAIRANSDAAETPEQRYYRSCADFVALQWCRFITYGVEHMQRIATCVSLSFVLLIVFFNSYSPQGPQMVARFVAGLFLAIGCVMTWVFAQMERNGLLSRIAHSRPGELNREFWIQILTLGGLPLLGVLTRLFPSLSQFLFQWVAPGVEALH